MTRQHYDTDLTDFQWELIRELIKRFLPKPKRRGPKPLDRRWVMDAILYINRTGCQWRNDGTWEKVHDALVVRVRKAMGKQSTPSAVIIDSSSASTTESGGEQRGYDASKKKYPVANGISLLTH